jgi:hypothetical protein
MPGAARNLRAFSALIRNAHTHLQRRLVLTRKPKTCSGNFFIDDEVLASEGVTDLRK